jgi:hypothetical protein
VSSVQKENNREPPPWEDDMEEAFDGVCDAALARGWAHGYPFADIRRAVSECSAVELSLSKEFHSLSVDQIDFLEIDGNRTRFGLDYVAKCVHMLFGKGSSWP